MHRTFFMALLCLATSTVFAQDTFYPPKVEISDYTLSRFLTELTLAVGRQDQTFILDHLDPNIVNSFGGDGGIEEFKEYWDFKNNSTRFWEVVEQLLLIGGPKYEEGSDSYTIPYTFTDWPEKFDAFEYYVVMGTNVNVRDKPTTSDSKVIGQLSYQIVKYNAPDWENQHKNPGWMNVTTTDGQITGYVFDKFLVSPIGYRMGFTKTTKGWVISMLVAGD